MLLGHYSTRRPGGLQPDRPAAVVNGRSFAQNPAAMRRPAPTRNRSRAARRVRRARVAAGSQERAAGPRRAPAPVRTDEAVDRRRRLHRRASAPRRPLPDGARRRRRGRGAPPRDRTGAPAARQAASLAVGHADARPLRSGLDALALLLAVTGGPDIAVVVLIVAFLPPALAAWVLSLYCTIKLRDWSGRSFSACCRWSYPCWPSPSSCRLSSSSPSPSPRSSAP